MSGSAASRRPDGIVDFDIYDDDGSADSTNGDDVIDAGHAPHAAPAWWTSGPLRVWLSIGALVLAVVVVSNVDRHARTTAGPAPVPSIVPSPTTRPLDPTDVLLTNFAALAQSQVPLTDNLRQLASTPPCPFVTSGDPVQDVLIALNRELPGYQLTDSSRTIDADTTLCAVEVRAHDALGATVVVVVTAHAGPDTPDIEAENSNDRTTSRDVTVIVDDWKAEVGWIGQTGDAPDFAGLLLVAHDPILRW